MNITDHAMFRPPQSDLDVHRQRRRALYLYASLLEAAYNQGEGLLAEFDRPEFLGGRPDLIDDTRRAQVALSRIMTWAWDVPLTPPAAPPQQPEVTS